MCTAMYIFALEEGSMLSCNPSQPGQGGFLLIFVEVSFNVDHFEIEKIQIGGNKGLIDKY